MKTSEEVEAKIARYRKFLQQDPSNLALATDLVDLLCNAGFFEQALACLEDFPDDLQNAVALRTKKAEVLLGSRNFISAKNYIEQLLNYDAALKQDATLLHFLGLSEYFLGEYESALDSFSKATDSDVPNSNNWKFLAYTHHQLNHLNEALSAAKKWIEIEPSADSYAYLAVVHFDSEERELAKVTALKALEMDATQSDALTVLGTLAVESNNLAVAVSSINQAISANAKNGRAWLAQGLILMSQVQTQSAILSLEEANRLMPTHVGTLISLGWAKVKCDDLKGAKLCFETAISIDRNFAESYGALACVFAMQANFKEAETNILLAKKLNPRNFAGNYARSIIFVSEGKQDQADALIEQLMLQKLPNTTSVLGDHLRNFLITSK